MCVWCELVWITRDFIDLSVQNLKKNTFFEYF